LLSIGIKNVTSTSRHFRPFSRTPGLSRRDDDRAMAQTAGVIASSRVEGTEKPRAVYFLTIDKCKFRKPVMPATPSNIHMTSIGRRKTMWWFHGDARSMAQLVAEADVGPMLTD